MTNYETFPVFREPCLLIENCSDGKLKTCSDVLNQLSKISSPLNVIAITGPYRTGKSYLLNRLAGKQRGFPLGSTIEATTKGIWVWCRQHPVRSNEVLLLMDTEGLGNISKGNEENVNWIFALAVLLSSTLVYNSLSDIDQDWLTKLHYATELTHRIETAGTLSNETGGDSYRFVPNLVWVLRGFFLRLERKGQPITSDEYLADVLKLKKGTGKAIDDYNRPRQYITEYFKNKKCFIFYSPVNEVEKMSELTKLSELELDSEFLDEVESFCSYIYAVPCPKTARGHPIQGRMFCSLLESYVSSIRNYNITSVEDALKTMAKEKENANALKKDTKIAELNESVIHRKELKYNLEEEKENVIKEFERKMRQRDDENKNSEEENNILKQQWEEMKQEKKQKENNPIGIHEWRRSRQLKKMDPAGDIDTKNEELEIQKGARGGELKKELAGKTEGKPAGKKVLQSGQVSHKEHERGNEVTKELHEKTMDTAWKGEIHDIFVDELCKKNLEEFLSVKRTESDLTNLLHVILAKNNKEALCIMMAYISKKWKEDFSDNTISVWLGYDHRGEKTGEMVLVCFHSAVTLSKVPQYLGLPMVYRRFDDTEMEPLENRLQEKYRTVLFNTKDEEIIKRLINEHGEDLFKLHSNLEAITASSVKSTKNGIIQETSILLYCRLKGVIPYSEEFFPKQLKVDDQDYVTDIREGFFSLGMNPAQRQPSNPHPHFKNNPLRMGCSIGTSGFPFAGTLGPFVRIGANEIGFLTCAHVLGITNSISKKSVVQPSDIESGLPDGTRLCGTFVKEKFDSLAKIGVDAALVCIDQKKRGFDLGKFVWMGSHQPQKIGMFEGNSPSFENGMVIGNPDLHKLGGMRDVCKFGRSTGLTQGLLLLENAMLKVHSANLALPAGMPLPPGFTHNTFIMKGQFLIQNVGNEPFFIPGDSGAGVYVVKRNQQGESKLALIGIAIGSLTSGECAMTPIGTVLEALELSESNIITEGVMEIDQ